MAKLDWLGGLISLAKWTRLVDKLLLSGWIGLVDYFFGQVDWLGGQNSMDGLDWLGGLISLVKWNSLAGLD